MTACLWGCGKKEPAQVQEQSQEAASPASSQDEQAPETAPALPPTLAPAASGDVDAAIAAANAKLKSGDFVEAANGLAQAVKGVKLTSSQKSSVQSFIDRLSQAVGRNPRNRSAVGAAVTELYEAVRR